MAREPGKYRDPRAERLRARGVIGAAESRPEIGSEAARRARAGQRINAMGPGLKAAVSDKMRTRRDGGIGPLKIASVALLGAIGFGVVGFVASGFIAMVLAAAIGFALTLQLCAFFMRQRRERAASDELESAEAFDKLLVKYTGRVPQEAIDTLMALKKSLAVVFADLAVARKSGVLADEDAFFAHELVRRYVPDAVDPFLAIKSPGADSVTAMQRQLTMLAERLRETEGRLDASHEQALIRNRKFLERRLGQ